MKIALKNKIWLLFSFSTFIILSIVLFFVLYFYHENWLNQEKIELNLEFSEMVQGGSVKTFRELGKIDTYIFLKNGKIYSQSAGYILSDIKKTFGSIDNFFLTIDDSIYNFSQDEFLFFNKYNLKGFGDIIIGENVKKYQEAESRFFYILLKIFISLILFILFFGYFFSRVSMNPIKNLQTVLKKVNPNNLLKIDFIDDFNKNDELFYLQESFKDLLNRIKKHQRQQEDFINFASHELRTPLSSLKTSLELSKKYPKKIDESIEEVDFLGKLINELLFLTKIENGFHEKEKINFSSFLEKEINKYKEKFLEKNIKIICSKKEKVFIDTNRELLIRVVENLFENAIKYNCNNNPVYIYLGEKYLEIKNSFKGDIDIKKISEAFYQGDGSRKDDGVGLGLYFVKKCLPEIGGKIQFNINNGYFSVKIIF